MMLPAGRYTSNRVHMTRSAIFDGRATSNTGWFTRRYHHIHLVLSVIRSHQSRMASSFALVPSQTRPFVSMIQFTSSLPTRCTTTQSG